MLHFINFVDVQCLTVRVSMSRDAPQEVRVGCSEAGVSSLELEEGGSPPARPSPPATPAPLPLHAPEPLATRAEPLELQLDYWPVSILSKCNYYQEHLY